MVGGNFREGSGYLVFMLRAWQESAPAGGGESGWRFDLEDPATRHRRGFSSLEELATFLRGLPSTVMRDPPGPVAAHQVKSVESGCRPQRRSP